MAQHVTVTTSCYVSVLCAIKPHRVTPSHTPQHRHSSSAAYAITAFDIGSMLVLLIAIAVIRGDSDRFTAYAERKKVSAADYTVFVRGGWR